MTGPPPPPEVGVDEALALVDVGEAEDSEEESGESEESVEESEEESEELGDGAGVTAALDEAVGVGRDLQRFPLTLRLRFAMPSCPRKISLAWRPLERALTGSAPKEQAIMASEVTASKLRSLCAIVRVR